MKIAETTPADPHASPERVSSAMELETRTPFPPRLWDLLRAFPCLDRVESCGSLEVLVGCHKLFSHGEQLAVRFVLSVWNPEAPEAWGLEAFDVHDAMGTWDAANREAFLGWARSPWWC